MTGLLWLVDLISQRHIVQLRAIHNMRIYLAPCFEAIPDSLRASGVVDILGLAFHSQAEPCPDVPCKHARILLKTNMLRQSLPDEVNVLPRDLPIVTLRPIKQALTIWTFAHEVVPDLYSPVSTAFKAMVLELLLLRNFVVEELAVHIQDAWTLGCILAAGGSAVASWAAWWCSAAISSTTMWIPIAAAASRMMCTMIARSRT